MNPIAAPPPQQKPLNTLFDIEAVKARLASKGSASSGQKIYRRGEIEDKLKAVVAGQDVACKLIGDLVSVLAAQEKKVEPAVFFLAGPPGTGKSFIAENLHRILTGEDGIQSMAHIDCSKLTTAQMCDVELYGVARGFDGADQGGKLPRALAKRPNSVVLFDECEKGHPSLYQSLLTAFNSGFIEDKYTRAKIAVGAATFIFASNKNQSTIAPMMGTVTTADGRHALLKKEYVQCEFLSPEFSDRVSKFIWLDRLKDDAVFLMISGVISGVVRDFDSRIKINQVTTDAAVALYEQLQSMEGGARELKRTVKTTVSIDILGMKQDGLDVQNIDIALGADGAIHAIRI